MPSATMVNQSERALILYQCAEMLKAHGYNCYITGDRLAVEVFARTLSGTYVTYTEHVTSIKEAKELIEEYK